MMIDISDLEKIGYTLNILKIAEEKTNVIIYDNKVSILKGEYLLRLIDSSLRNEEYSITLKLLNLFDEETFKNNYVDYLYYYFLYNISIKKENVLKSSFSKLVINDHDKKYVNEENLFGTILYDIDDYPFQIKEVDLTNYSKYIILASKYIKIHEYRLAYESLNFIPASDLSLTTKKVKELLSFKDYNNLFLLDKSTIKDKKSREALYDLEYKTLIYLELEDMVNFSKMISKLFSLYQEQDLFPIKIISNLVKYNIEFLKNRRILSISTFQKIHGDYLSVLFHLTEEMDFYRAKEVVEKEIKKENKYSIINHIYLILLERIISIDKVHRLFITKEISDFKTNSNDTMSEILDNYDPLGIISGKMLRDYEEEMSKKEVRRENYYQLYLRKVEENNFDEAKTNLDKFIAFLNSIDIYVNYDYLYKELNTYKSLYEKYGEEKFKELKTILISAQKLENEGKLEEATSKYEHYIDETDEANPRVLAILGRLYYKQDKLDKSLELYKEAEEYYLFPQDYQIIIEVLFKLNKFKEIIKYFNLLDNYLPSEDGYYYYLMSIVYLHLKQFDEAEKSLKRAQEINLDYYNVLFDYEDEFKVIETLKSGGDANIYSVDDYINFAYSYKDDKVKEEIKNLESIYNDDFLEILLLLTKRNDISNKDKIDYLLSVVKIVKSEAKKVSLDKVYDYLDNLLEDKSISNDELRRFTLAMKNYKNI